MLLKLGQLRELVYHLHFDSDTVSKNAARTGWATVFTINDLARVLEEPIPAAAVSLHGTWDQYSDELGSSRASKDAIVLEIDSMRDITLEMLQKLD